MNLRYICAQPANDYYLWQVETIINNFMKNGVNPNHIDILLAIDNNVIPPKWAKMRDNYNYVRFFFYNDTRNDKKYIPAIYFNLMKHHLVHHPELSKEVLFLHDSDIVFTKQVDFKAMIDDNIWYLSDTNSYINYDYIKQKGDDIYNTMCDIIGIDKLIPKLMNSNSGGAQYIVKNTNFEFWDKVEKDSIKLYQHFCDVEHLYVKKHEYDYPIQKWTAGMWSLLWNAWLFGHETKVDKRLDFGWSTNHISDVEKYSILHNSGVTSGSEGLFFKGEYTNKLPYDVYPNLDKEKASYFYWQEVQDAGKKSPMIERKIEDVILSEFNKHKISQLQLDPYGVCNAKCWFCPVKYKGNPEEGRDVMSPELLEKIIKNLIDEREKEDGLVSKSFNGFYTAHYNEVLLYKHFDVLLELARKYKLMTMILSNGVPLTPEKIDLIKKYPDVVNGICLNIPAFEKETWSKRAGINEKLFDKLVSNIKYAIQELPHMVENKSLSIQINGVHDLSFGDKGGWLEKGKDFPEDLDLNPNDGEIKKQEDLARHLFPELNIFSSPYLIDRAGLLDNVMTNKPAIERNLMNNNLNKKVIGCANGREVGGRPVGWLHVNASGDAFLCCNDYDFDFKFGNFKTNELSDFWGKQEHIDKIKESYETICTNCASAIFED
jgi:MoaA/NifB/PqqE/SkfB family radical SAM enzyme